MWAQIYMYANKKPHYGMMEIIEVSEVATERRNAMVELIKQHPPDWIVTDETARVGYDYGKYRNVAKVNNFVVYKRY
jgi:nucleoside 2-deoxyribosyltransferase